MGRSNLLLIQPCMSISVSLAMDTRQDGPTNKHFQPIASSMQSRTAMNTAHHKISNLLCSLLFHCCDKIPDNKQFKEGRIVFLAYSWRRHTHSIMVGKAWQATVGSWQDIASSDRTQKVIRKWGWVYTISRPESHFLQPGSTCERFHNLPKQSQQVGTNRYLSLRGTFHTQTTTLKT